jgi:hypothetical protein
MGWVGKEDFTKYAFKAPTKLHCFHSSKGENVFVDPPPAVITNPMGATAMLGDNPGRRESKARQVENFLCRENNPLALVNHIIELLLEEVNIFQRGTMQAP